MNKLPARRKSGLKSRGLKSRGFKPKVKKGDVVKVIAGAHKGKSGKVLQILVPESRILVEGVNMRNHRVRSTEANPRGGVEMREVPLHYSNVQLMDSAGKPTRVGMRIVAQDGQAPKRERVARTTGEVV